MSEIEFIIYIILAIFLILCILFLYFPFNNKNNPDQILALLRKQKVNETIQWLYGAVNDICYQCNMSPIYEIIETSQITYTEKGNNFSNIKSGEGKIYLVIWNESQEQLFNYNTLIYAMLHEIAHILSPSVHHKPPFDSIESKLLNKARDLNYYNPNISLESNYMTLDLNNG